MCRSNFYLNQPLFNLFVSARHGVDGKKEVPLVESIRVKKTKTHISIDMGRKLNLPVLNNATLEIRDARRSSHLFAIDLRTAGTR